MVGIFGAPTVSVAAFAVGLLVIVLGLYITWRAYQGYRRNDNRPMVFFALGMLLITVIPPLVDMIIIPLFIGRYLPASSPAFEYALLISRTCEATGIVILLYSLHIRHS